MVDGKKVVVILPAFNAAKTLEITVSEIPRDVVDQIILTDDASTDNTLALAKTLGIDIILSHEKNEGYGRNQKSCYDAALAHSADVVIMLHPDYQYTPKLIPAMANLIASETYDVILGSRILGGGALKGGMPIYKYIGNRFLTFIQNLATGAKLSEYHTGYRAFSRKVLEEIPYQMNSDGFIFDNEILSQILLQKFSIGEVSCPTKYFPEASSINLQQSMYYGFGVLRVSIIHAVKRMLS